MKSLHIETFIDNNVGLASKYYWPAESDILEDYMTHAADSLTIDPTFRLQKHVAKLETERTEEIERLKTEMVKLWEESHAFATSIDESNLVLKNMIYSMKKRLAKLMYLDK